MEQERIAYRLELLKLACAKVSTPDGIIALAAKLEEHLYKDELPKGKKRKSDNVETPKTPD
jgi:hypothetical protein